MTKDEIIDILSNSDINVVLCAKLSAYIDELQQDNKHLLELQKSMDKQYEELEKENQQLKEDKIQLEAKLGEADDIIDIEIELRDMWIEKYHKLRQVLDEIRENIEYYD